MLRKLSAPLLSLLFLSALLVACGGQSSTGQPTAAPAAEATEAPAAEATQAPAAEAATEAPTVVVPTTIPVSGDRTTLGLWTHSAGNEGEMEVITKMVNDFNASQEQYAVSIEAFPQASYNDSVAAASVAGSLPCIIDLDGPTVPNFAWSGYVQPLPITDELRSQLSPAAVGTYKGEAYSVGQFDVALLIYGRRSVLEEHNIRIPTLDEPWTKDEFMAALQTLKDSGDFEYPLDVNSGGTGEWWSYAYSPMLQSFGGDLINRENFTEAEGVLNGPEALAWGEWFQSLFEEGYANPTPADDQSFLQGRVPLWYTGSWSANDVVEAYGDDALFLPTVDLGNGPKIGGASWQWGISSACDDPEGAWQFIEYMMQPEQIALMSETTGLVPTTEAAAALTENYKEGGPYRIFFEMSQRFAVLRPETPGYLTISNQFEQASLAIRDGADVQNTLDDAVDAIEQDIEDNNNYGF
ncbi:MAG: extracellular solute-binding protein [Chloroflexales bacterium]|nr:extracellular solute-binding protein [Chloroflexales bacterium]